MVTSEPSRVPPSEDARVDDSEEEEVKRASSDAMEPP